MTKFSNHPDADSTPNDIGPPDNTNRTPPTWDDFHDDETNELIMSERKIF